MIGVSRADESIAITKELCPGDRVTEVRLVLAPDGVPEFGEDDIMWRITSETGSTQETYEVGVTATGFVETVPLSRSIGRDLELAATVDTLQDADALKVFEPRELRQDELLTPDGYFTPEEFESRHRDRCDD